MEKFLETLESYLTLLEEKEQKKIIKRYQNELSLKMKEGMTETEAVQSLGSLDDIVSQLYEEYHLDKKSIGKKDTIGSKLERVLRSCAKFLADTCAETAYYLNHISSSAWETIFEILLKVLILGIVISAMKFPFLCIENLLQYLLNFLFYPFDKVLSVILNFTTSIIYLLICITLAIVMFKGYAKKGQLVKEKEKKDKIKIESSNQARNYAYILLKVCLYIICIIPMILITFALLILTVLALFLVYKGISVIGLVVILVGLLFLSIVVTTYITDALDNRNRSHTFAIVVTVIALISGSILLVDNLMNFHYPETLNQSAFIPHEKTVTLEILKETNLLNLNGELEFFIDNTIDDNVVLVQMEYYDELYDVALEQSDQDLWLYTVRNNFEINDFHYLYQNVLQDLTNRYIFNYKDLSSVKIIVYGNENTEKLLTLK